jgi:hypothetical protein
MDCTLHLRQLSDTGQILSADQVSAELAESDLLRHLTAEIGPGGLFPVWRLLALSEIPSAGSLDFTHRLVGHAVRQFATDQGFSVMGGADALLPCYNAMLVYAISRLGFADHPTVAAGVQWITTYQPFDRQIRSTWKGKGVKKYGGCMNATPCYIGLAKCVKALLAYRRYGGVCTPQVDDCIDRGVETILKHQLYLRMSQPVPITSHILDISFPESYHLNILELLQIMEWAGRLPDERCKPALDYLKCRKKSNGWRVNYRYKSAGYVCFDPPGQPAEWVSYLIERYAHQAEK